MAPPAPVRIGQTDLEVAPIAGLLLCLMVREGIMLRVRRYFRHAIK